MAGPRRLIERIDRPIHRLALGLQTTYQLVDLERVTLIPDRGSTPRAADSTAARPNVVLQALQERSHCYTEHFRNLQQIPKADVLFASLDLADIGSMQAADMRKLLL